MKPIDLSSAVVVDLTAIQTAIEELQRLFGGELPLWRGHRDFGWKLQPHVFRPTAVATRSHDDEARLLLDFQAKAHSRYQRCPRNEDRIDWLMLTRHYGLATRLLDWSWSPLTALHFALDGETMGAFGLCRLGA
jgi:hypothetical protein